MEKVEAADVQAYTESGVNKDTEPTNMRALHQSCMGRERERERKRKEKEREKE